MTTPRQRVFEKVEVLKKLKDRPMNKISVEKFKIIERDLNRAINYYSYGLTAVKRQINVVEKYKALASLYNRMTIDIREFNSTLSTQKSILEAF